VITTAAPLASVPLIIRLGSAKYPAAPCTSPWRSASAQALITATAAGRAGIPVAPGVGTTGWPDCWGSVGNAGARWAWRVVVARWRVVVLELAAPDPHPTTIPVAMTAMNEAQLIRAITHLS
jgi:hypothetical protein